VSGGLSVFLARTQSLDEEMASRRSHLDDVDRWRSVVVVVVVGILKGKAGDESSENAAGRCFDFRFLIYFFYVDAV